MRFQVPQFIEKESKVIGPLTIMQFLWFLGAGIVFIFLQFFLKGAPLIVAAIILAGLGAAMGFAKIDDVSLPRYLLRGFQFFMSEKKYTFEKEQPTESEEYKLRS